MDQSGYCLGEQCCHLNETIQIVVIIRLGNTHWLAVVKLQCKHKWNGMLHLVHSVPGSSRLTATD